MKLPWTVAFVAPCVALLCGSPAWTEESPPEPHMLRVAAIQIEVTDNLDVNLSRIVRGIDEAAAAEARVAVFPETALSGFDKATIAKLDWKRLREAMDKIAAQARERGIYVLYGSATEFDQGRPRNSAILVGPDGREIERYHKMVPEGWFHPGDHLALFEIDGIPCTVMVCHDERFPEIVRLPVLSGALVCFYISYEINPLESALRKADGYRSQLVARAAENGIWICQANGIGPLGPAESKSLGQSRIVDPGGGVVAEAPALADAMLVEDIDLARAKRGNALETLDVAGLGDWWREGARFVKKSSASADAGSAGEDVKDGSAEANSEPEQARLALMQAVPVKWDLDSNFNVFLKDLKAASEAGAEIFVTPECWLDGYAAADPESTPEKLRGIAQSSADSPYLKRVADEARARSMHICFGFTSVENTGVGNASGLWNDRGELVGVYLKTHLQKHDLQFTAGDSLPVWPTRWGPVGIMICADRRWPETARTLRLKGARLILNPSYGMHGEENEWWMRTRAYENQCFVAFTHPESGFVAGPRGDIAGRRSESPGVLICDIDLSRAVEDNHLRDRRPELYKAITDQK